MTHEELFNFYQSRLAWVERRLEPETLEFYKESKESWKHAKEVIFDFYEHMRYYTDGGIPNYKDCFDYNNKLIHAYKPYTITSEEGITTEFPCIGILKYRGQKWPIYNDDYGCQDFIVLENDYQLPICNMSGELDWYYELDRILDKIYELENKDEIH